MHIAPRKVQVEAADKFVSSWFAPAANNEGDEKDPNRWQERLDIMRDVAVLFQKQPQRRLLRGLQPDPQRRPKYEADGRRENEVGPQTAIASMGTRSNDDKVTNGIREGSSTMDGAGGNTTTPLWDAEYARG